MAKKIDLFAPLNAATPDGKLAEAGQIYNGDKPITEDLKVLDYTASKLGVTVTDAVSITASFAQGNEWVYAGDELDILQQYLTVEAMREDGSTVTVEDYALAGVLTEGMSTITVLYGALSTTFAVKVTGALPEGYTRLDYIMPLRKSSVNSAKGILTKKYPDLNVLSLNLVFGHTLGTAYGDASEETYGVILGGFSNKDDWTNGVLCVGVSPSGVTVTAHGKQSDKLAIALKPNTRHRLMVQNSTSSPSTFSVDGAALQTIPWGAASTANVALAIGSPYCEGENRTLYAGIQCGEFELTALDGTVAGHYIPCVRDSDYVIGLYETVDGAFYTAENAASATTDDSNNCLYRLANWEQAGGAVSSSGVDYSHYKKEVWAACPMPNVQAGDYANGVFFTCLSFGDGKMALIDYKTRTEIARYTRSLGHGNSLSFRKVNGEVKASPEDEFPLAVDNGRSSVSSPEGTTIDTVDRAAVQWMYEIRVTREALEVHKTYAFPRYLAGFAAGLCIDEATGIGYTIGSTSFTTYDSNSRTQICKWNMKDLTDNGDETYTPAFIASVEGPHIDVLQGIQLHDGLLWVADGAMNVTAKIHAIDPDTGVVTYYINTGTQKEIESIGWINRNEFIANYAGGIFEKYTFAVVGDTAEDTSNAELEDRLNGLQAALEQKQNKISFDPAPLAGSSNLVTSGGVKSALAVHDNLFSKLGMAEKAIGSITAALNMKGWVHAGDPLDALRPYLTVTAHGETSVAVENYTLSGVLESGMSTIVATYKGLSTSFTVHVLPALPTGYTRHDYIMSKNGQQYPDDAARILTKKYDDLYLYNLSLVFGHTLGTEKGNASSSTSGFVLGGRGTDEWTKNSFNVNVSITTSDYPGGVKMNAHSRESDRLQIELQPDTKHFLYFTNTTASPSYFTVDGSGRQNIPWNSTTDTANTALGVCTRHRENGSATLNAGTQCGEFELTALDGTVVGHYVPCVRDSDSVIGLYETVDGIFYTAENTTKVNQNHANCLYMVGDWDIDSGSSEEEEVVGWNGITRDILAPDVQSYLPDSPYKGKNFSILGDSISTFSGYIPEGHAAYYPGTKNILTDVNDTWWMRTITALGGELLVNQSWSGSKTTTVDDTTEIQKSGVVRCEALDKDGVSPDVVIVYLGINDFNSNHVTFGTYDGRSVLPTATDSFREAYAIMLNKIHTAYPMAEVWACTLPPCEKYGDVGAPEINQNGISQPEWNDAIRQLASAFNVGVIDLASCGLNYANRQTYMEDWWAEYDTFLHPNVAGHALIANKVIKTLDPYTWARVNRWRDTTNG